VLEQQKPDYKLAVLGRPADIGKRLPVLILEVLPGNKIRDPKPTVPCVELAAEGKKFGKKMPATAVFRAIHPCGLLRNVHGFRGIKRDSRALEALDSHKIYNEIILYSRGYVKSWPFSADPK
jgi:hypothetical protein